MTSRYAVNFVKHSYKTRRPLSRRHTTCVCARMTLTLNYITLIFDLDLDIMKMYLPGKMKFLDQSDRKLQPETHTHRQTRVRYSDFHKLERPVQ